VKGRHEPPARHATHAMRATHRAAVALLLVSGVAVAQSDRRDGGKLRPGINVLLDEQISKIRGRRVALIVDAGARDERGDHVDAILAGDKRVRAARVVVTSTWHAGGWQAGAGAQLGSGTAADLEQRTRLGAIVDSVTQGAQVVVVDLLDGGTRSSAAPWIMLASLRSAARQSIAVVVLDRPNPLTGEHAEGPAADSIQGASDALYGLPARHGMTLGEIARWFNMAGAIGAALDVVPVRGWRRSSWPSDRGMRSALPDGRPIEPAQLAMLGTFAPLTATSLAFEPGPGRNSVRVGAPWLDARGAGNALGDRLMAGMKFRAYRDEFPAGPGGSPTSMPCVGVDVTDRDAASGLRALLAILSTARKPHPERLTFDAPAFDRLVGSPAVRLALLAGDDPDAIADRYLAGVIDFRRRVRTVLLYR
jgi:uncharacterized protein YbbC (DUF1343 family)